MMMRRLLLFLFLGSVLHAETPLEIRLVSEVKSIQPGQPFYVGLALHHGRGYHTYWKHPGIVGVPTGMAWKDLPAGFKAEPIDWPEPEPVLMFQIKAQGYERDVVLPIRITPPANLIAGDVVKLGGKASWMCCNQECNPGFKDLALELPVSSGTEPDFDVEWRGKFERERALRPVESSAWQARATESEKTIALTLKPLPNAAKISAASAAKIIFFTEDGLIDSNKPQVVRAAEDGTLTFTLVKADFILGNKPTHLNGVLLHPSGWLADGSLRCLRVSPALTPAQ
jgi:thiol:disulfide interchange protein DsbD